MNREQAESLLSINDPDPSQMQIMRAFRKAAFKAHPDQGGNDHDFCKVVNAKRLMLTCIGALQTTGHGRFTASDLQEGVAAFKNMGFVQESPVHREAWYQKHIVNKLKDVGAEVYKIHGHAMQVAGIPDLWIGCVAWQGWIEMKAEYGKLRSTQRVKLQRMEHRRVPAVVLRGFDKMYVIEDSNGEPLITRSFARWGDFNGSDILADLRIAY